ncbi:hypothetical protein ACFVGN_35220 [Streptomyces sp. NPDC057757]|uniref:hypothetical protein n=1 Tax=Streptomyces sp. NPDC057757 TaxID=3346241 RepID=UPI0036CFF29C
MNSSPDGVITAVADALEQRAAGRGQTVRALGSVRGLVANGDAEIAVDHLVNTVNSFRLALSRDEYDRLMAAATALDYADCVTDIDPGLLVPGFDDA